MAFNSSDLAAFKGGVWVFCEQRNGKLMPTDYELISEGRKLANERGVELCGLLLGGKGIAQRAGAVRAAVLHQHQLQIVRCTLQHAFNRLAQRVLGLIAGDHHPNGGQAHSVPSLCRTLR